MSFKKNTKNKLSSRRQRINRNDKVITTAKLVPFFDNLKELIKSTAKGTKTALRMEFKKELGYVRRDIEVTQQALKATKEELVDEIQQQVGASEKKVRGEMGSMKEELRGEMSSMKKELRGEMRGMEFRLSQKIDRGSTRLDNHEVRITALEQSNA